MRWSGRRIVVAERFTPLTIRDRHPHLVVTSITPFGLHGPWRDRAATEFTLQAWSGGIVGLGRGVADRAPVFVGGQVGEYLAGAYASAAILAARHTAVIRVNSSTCRCWRPRSSASLTIR